MKKTLIAAAIAILSVNVQADELSDLQRDVNQLGNQADRNERKSLGNREQIVNLHGRVDGEIENRAKQDKRLDGRINSEAENRRNQDKNLHNRINIEAQASRSADSYLGSQIDNNALAISNNAAGIQSNAHDISTLRGDMYSGIASSLAVGSLPQAQPGKSIVSIGAGAYANKASFAFGAGITSENGHTLNVNFVTDSSSTGASASFGYSF